MPKKKKHKPWSPAKQKKPVPDIVDKEDIPSEAPLQALAPDTTFNYTDNDSLLTVPETCTLLKISRRTLERSNIPGKLKIGHLVRYHRQTIAQWLHDKIANPQARASASHERQSEA